VIFNELRTEYKQLLKTYKKGKEYTVDITDAGKAGLVIFIKKYKSRGQKYKD